MEQICKRNLRVSGAPIDEVTLVLDHQNSGRLLLISAEAGEDSAPPGGDVIVSETSRTTDEPTLENALVRLFPRLEIVAGSQVQMDQLEGEILASVLPTGEHQIGRDIHVFPYRNIQGKTGRRNGVVQQIGPYPHKAVPAETKGFGAATGTGSTTGSGWATDSGSCSVTGSGSTAGFGGASSST